MGKTPHPVVILAFEGVLVASGGSAQAALRDRKMMRAVREGARRVVSISPGAFRARFQVHGELR